jgi:predicted RNA binding protein YcfA (HicA-like mRNA interferase family)
MTRLPALRPKDVIAALGRAGFETVRVRGSHYQLHNPSSGRRVSFPRFNAGDAFCDPQSGRSLGRRVPEGALAEFRLSKQFIGISRIHIQRQMFWRRDNVRLLTPLQSCVV